MTTSTKNLLAELDAEFGKAAQKKAKRDAKAIAVATVHGSNTTVWTEGAVANAVAGSLRNQPGWKPTARVTHVMHEHCDFCAGSVSYIGNQFTLFENKRLKAKLHEPELITHDDLGFELQHIVEEHIVNVPHCAKCLRLSRNVSDLVAACFIANREVQLELSFPQ